MKMRRTCHTQCTQSEERGIIHWKLDLFEFPFCLCRPPEERSGSLRIPFIKNRKSFFPSSSSSEDDKTIFSKLATVVHELQVLKIPVKIAQFIF